MDRISRQYKDSSINVQECIDNIINLYDNHSDILSSLVTPSPKAICMMDVSARKKHNDLVGQGYYDKNSIRERLIISLHKESNHDNLWELELLFVECISQYNNHQEESYTSGKAHLKIVK